MKRSYVYIIVILLTITLVSSDYIIGRDLQSIVPLEDTYKTLNDDLIKQVGVVGNITIKNEQNTDEVITYDYTIKIEDLAGSYKYIYNGQEKYLIFAANGEANFQLKSNESITLYEIPIDSVFAIRQQTENSKYTVKANDETTNLYRGRVEANSSITFNNSTKSAPSKNTNKEQKQENKKESKKQIPNTGETEIRLTLILIISLLVIICFKKMRIKRFD